MMKLKLIIAVMLAAAVVMACDGDGTDEQYSSKWETCSVVDVVGNTVTLECNGIYKYADNTDGTYYPGDIVTARSDYVTILEQTEIEPEVPAPARTVRDYSK